MLTSRAAPPTAQYMKVLGARCLNSFLYYIEPNGIVKMISSFNNNNNNNSKLNPPNEEGLRLLF